MQFNRSHSLAEIVRVDQTAPARNIIFFLVDDGGFELGSFGNKIIKTPHIDALASRGTAFDAAFVAVSSCSPSRSAILTGLPTHQNGMYGLHQYPGTFQSWSDAVSLPNLLHAAGYKTGVIGKYHIGPTRVYNFTYGTSRETCWAGLVTNPYIDESPNDCRADYNLVSRNITHMKLNARTFLRSVEPSAPFFLYVGFGDVHRCREGEAAGAFCEKFGDRHWPGGTIADWVPQIYPAAEVLVPPFLPDTPTVRTDLAAQYTAMNRMDQGVGLILGEVGAAGAANTTLTVFFSDNGIPFPSGKTNLAYEQGQRSPLLISSPLQATRGRRSPLVVSALDIMPTILAWATLSYPASATAGGKPASLTGASLLGFLDDDDSAANVWRGSAYGSHQFHSLYAYYPVRSLRTASHRLVHNLAFDLTFPILEDVYGTSTWRAIEAAGEAGTPTGWVYNYSTYLRRPEWQLCDVQADPLCLCNLAQDAGARPILAALQHDLHEWRRRTHDPWLACNPSAPHPGATWTESHSEVCSF